MHMVNNQQLTETNRLLSMYRTLHVTQLYRFFPDLSETAIQGLVKRLKKQGRASYDPLTGILRWPGADRKENEIISALWVLLDFFPAVTYHTVGSFPSVLTFYTEREGYDVISVPPEQELLYRHALPVQQGGNRRLVIIQETGQIQHADFPQTAAFCLVSGDGQVQYFKKQGETDDQ